VVEAMVHVVWGGSHEAMVHVVEGGSHSRAEVHEEPVIYGNRIQPNMTVTFCIILHLLANFQDLVTILSMPGLC